jgi:hypothetical protein
VALEEAALPVNVDFVWQERDPSAVGHALLDVLHNGLQEKRLQRGSDSFGPGKSQVVAVLFSSPRSLGQLEGKGQMQL